MFKFLKRLFSKGETEDLDSTVELLWESKLKNEAQGRFLAKTEPFHSSFYKEDSLYLQIKKQNYFAWTENPKFRYTDFILEADISMISGEQTDADRVKIAPSMASGFLFRQTNDDNFYYILVSDAQTVRMDVVFNGSPMTLIDWTSLPEMPKSNIFRLRIIARGSHFTIIVNEQWFAEAEDSTLASGKFSFACQNYGQNPSSSARLLRLDIDSRPMEVESAYYKWNSLMPVKSEARINLARTFILMQDFVKAVIELKRAENAGDKSDSTLFLHAECLLNLRLFDDAIAKLEEILAQNPSHKDAKKEKAAVYYLTGSYIKLKDWVLSILSDFPDDAVLENYAGHAFYNIGNKIDAAKHYAKAALIDPLMPIFGYNAAKTFDEAGAIKEALEEYKKCARLFYRDESYEDCAQVLARLKELDSNYTGAKELEAKMQFQASEHQKAFEIISTLKPLESDDSVIPFLYAVILCEQNKHAEAIEYFEYACKLEATVALYFRRYAEAKQELMLDALPLAEKALSLDESDAWTHNLLGQIYTERNELEKAQGYFNKALELLKDEPVIAINASELVYKTRNLTEALAILEPFSENAEAQNHKGNLYAKERLYNESFACYRKAVSLNPYSIDYLLNLAAVCIELEQFGDAEEALRKVLERTDSDARAYLLTGNLAMLLGETVRAETALRLALNLDPYNPEILSALAHNYLSRYQFDKAKDVIADLKRTAGKERAQALEDTLLDATTDKIHCASCEREWRTPKSIPSQNASKIYAEPPEESPAGSCPLCGKVYCIACRKPYLVDERFTCPSCNVPLKLIDNRVKYLVLQYLAQKS